MSSCYQVVIKQEKGGGLPGGRVGARMSVIYDFHQGRTPLLLSIPHAGTEVPEQILRRLTGPARGLPDTDWHVLRLYDWAKDLGASLIKANYSRYVVDLNRPPDDESLYPGQATTALCPETLFDGTPLYDKTAPLARDELSDRRERYWLPYHQKLSAELERIKSAHGHALLYDAHSIASHVPRLFDGRLPDLNFGTAHGQSCTPKIESAIVRIIRSSEFSSVINGRFVGGYITRHYGRPADHVDAVQMEIAQCSYMDEIQGFPYDDLKAQRLQPVLRQVLSLLLQSPA